MTIYVYKYIYMYIYIYISTAIHKSIHVCIDDLSVMFLMTSCSSQEHAHARSVAVMRSPEI